MEWFVIDGVVERLRQSRSPDERLRLVLAHRGRHADHADPVLEADLRAQGRGQPLEVADDLPAEIAFRDQRPPPLRTGKSVAERDRVQADLRELASPELRYGDDGLPVERIRREAATAPLLTRIVEICGQVLAAQPVPQVIVGGLELDGLVLEDEVPER